MGVTPFSTFHSMASGFPVRIPQDTNPFLFFVSRLEYTPKEKRELELYYRYYWSDSLKSNAALVI